MNTILKVKNVRDYSEYVGHQDTHPLVCVIDYSEVSPIRHCLCNYSVYGLFIRDDDGIDLKYGLGKYDYAEGTLICVAPGQVGGKEENGELAEVKGWALLFHPDFLHGTHLEDSIKGFSFFDYSVNEALHMSKEEHDTLVTLMGQIKAELQKRHDEFQDSIVCSYIETMLNYCQRFYSRQFLTRKIENTDLLQRFNALLNDYFHTGKPLSLGLPTVQYFADALCLSSNYFGDLIKRTSGDTASHHIRNHLIQQIKNHLASGETISQVAYSLGFEYPQHLSRMFKKHTGMSPKDYLALIKRQR